MTLRDSPRNMPRGERDAASLMDRDVAAVVEALRQSGAEALAITGTPVGGGGADALPLRILFTTRIAASAPTGSRAISVDGVPLRPPYRVLAIGGARALRAALFRPDGVARTAALDVLGMIEVQDIRRIEIPAARAPFVPRFARPLAARVRERVAIETRPAPRRETPRAAGSEGGIRPVGDPGSGARGTGKPPAQPGPTIAAVEPRRGRPYALATAQAPAAVFGGRGLERYHLPGCRFGERVPSSQRIRFPGSAEAILQGRTPCSVCRPDRTARAH